MCMLSMFFILTNFFFFFYLAYPQLSCIFPVFPVFLSESYLLVPQQEEGPEGGREEQCPVPRPLYGDPRFPQPAYTAGGRRGGREGRECHLQK